MGEERGVSLAGFAILVWTVVGVGGFFLLIKHVGGND